MSKRWTELDAFESLHDSVAGQNEPVVGQVQDENLVERFRSLISSHFESLLPVLVREYEKSISLLQADNQNLRKKLLEFDGSFAAPERESGPGVAASSQRGQAAIDALNSTLNSNSIDSTLEDQVQSMVDQWNHVNKAVETDTSKNASASDAADPCDDNEAGLGGVQRAQEDDVGNTVPAGMKSEDVLFSSQSNTHNVQSAQQELPTSFPFPKESWNLVQRVVFSNSFEILSGGVILANTLIMALQLQYTGFDHASFWFGDPAASEIWPGAETTFDILDMVFNFLFTLELLLRFFAFRQKALCSAWIWFDTVVITLSLAEMVFKGGVPIDPGMMRVVRLIRLVRLLKVFHAMSGFDSLFLLMKAVQASIHAAVWSFMVMVLVQIIMGLFLCQFLQGHLEDETIGQTSAKEVFKYFGTFSRTMLTMFEITFGAWHVSCRMLMEQVSEWFSLFYIAYRCLFLFALLKVIAAVFITETNRVLEHDDELTIIKANRDLLLFSRSFERLMGAVDTNKDGMLNWTELEMLLNDEGMQKMLPTIGFDKNDLMKMFWLVENGTGEVSQVDFFRKLCKLKGPAKKINELAILKMVHKIQGMLEGVWTKQGLLERRDQSEEKAAERAVGLD